MLLSGCGNFDMCGNKVLQRVKSPDGQYKAVIFSRDCGATTGYSTHVSILSGGAPLSNDAGNVFVSDDSDGSDRKGAKELQVWVKWLGFNRLRITYRSGETIFRNDTKHNDVTVNYQSR